MLMVNQYLMRTRTTVVSNLGAMACHTTAHKIGLRSDMAGHVWGGWGPFSFYEVFQVDRERAMLYLLPNWDSGTENMAQDYIRICTSRYAFLVLGGLGKDLTGDAVKIALTVN